MTAASVEPALRQAECARICLRIGFTEVVIEWKLTQGDRDYRVRAVKRGLLLRENGEGETGLGEALTSLIYERLLSLGSQYKVGVLLETHRDELGWAPNRLQLLYREVLPKGTDPRQRASELRDLVQRGHFDTWSGRRKNLEGA